MTRLADNAELLVSELVTNAITASRALGDYLPIRPYLLSDAARVVIMVWDPQQSKQELTQDGGGQSPWMADGYDRHVASMGGPNALWPRQPG